MPRVLPVVSALALATASAQPAKRQYRDAITDHGGSCSAVTESQAIDATASGDPLVAVACSNGSRHVVRIMGNARVVYVATCRVFEITNDAECFAD